MSTNDPSIDYLVILPYFFKIDKIILIVLGILCLLFISKIIKNISDKLYKHIPTRKTLIFQVATILTFCLNIFGSFYIFYIIFKPPREFLIAALGSITVASGLAIKDLVASIISGISIIIDPPFQVGDRILFKNIYGEIKHIGLRSIKVQNLDDNIITIPNQNFLHDYVLCATKGQIHINVITSFYIALNADINLARQIILEIVQTSNYAYLNEPIKIIVAQEWVINILCLRLTVSAYTIDASLEKDFQTELATRVTEAFLKANIPIPKE